MNPPDAEKIPLAPLSKNLSASVLAPQAPARIGKICYMNSIPFYHRLTEFEFYEAVPAKLNAAMQDGRVDIAPISSLEYLNHQKDYVLLPYFAIGSRDFSGSVLLLSKEKIEGLNGERIALSRESLSSAALLRILLRFRYKFENEFVTGDSNPEPMLAANKAALVIGDDALFYQPKEFVYKYDLSELWWNWTGKPFCFALWAVRREFAEARHEEVAEFSQRLRQNLIRNLVDIETLVKEAFGMTFMDERFPKVFVYLFNLTYTLDDSMREGLELFYRLAHRLGISPRPRTLEFFK